MHQRLSPRFQISVNGGPYVTVDLATDPIPSGVSAITQIIVDGDTIALDAGNFGGEWKYIPVRRLALMIEESHYRGTRWVVFEPNDEPLWAKIRLNVGALKRTTELEGWERDLDTTEPDEAS